MRENRSWEFNWRKTQLSPAGAEAELGNISLEKIVNIVCIFVVRIGLPPSLLREWPGRGPWSS